MTALVLVTVTAIVVAWVLRPVFTAPRPAVRESACPSCGPRPEADARFCSNCGRALSGAAAPGAPS